MKNQNTTRSYLVNLVAGETGTTRVWNSRKPMTVGHPLRWVLEQERDGVRIRSLESKGSLPKKAVEELFLKHSEIEKSGHVVLVDGPRASEGFHLELRPVASVEPVYAANEGNSLRIYFCKNEWAIESHLVGGDLVARADGQKIFQLKGNPTGFYSETDTIEIESMADGVHVGGHSLPRGEKRKVSFAKMPETAISRESSTWRFAHVSKSSAPESFAAPVAADGEAKLFNKILKGAMVATLLLGLLTWFLPSEQPLKVEKVRIVLNKKKTVKGYMTAAPKGDPRAKDFSIGKHGLAKNAGRKGTPNAARSAKIAPSGKQHPRLYSQEAAKGPKRMTVAKNAAKASTKSGAGHPSHPSKAVSKPAQTKVARSAPKQAPRRSAVRVSQASAVAVVPHSELFKTLSSASFRRTAKSVASGGVSGSARSTDSYASARNMGAAGGGTAAGAVGGAGGVSTRGAEIHGFGGGGGQGDGGPGSAGYGYGRGSYAKVSGQGRSFVSLDTGASDVEEGLTREQVGRVINSHMNEIRYCYDSAALRAKSIEGTMNLKFTVGAPGDVISTGLGQGTTGDRRLHDCILAHLRTWKFPKPKGGVKVAIGYPLYFKSLAR